jgi:CheY-like chemotaxis protein
MIVRGSVDLIRRGAGDEKRTKHLQAIAEAADRAVKLTAQMLSFARRQDLSPQLVDPKWQLDGFSELIARSIGPGIELRLDLPRSLPQVLADPTQLEIAVLNLALNARDAMNGEGVLTVSAAGTPNGDEVVISVVDTGPGMDDQTKSRAFEPFFTTKGPGKGTGLGLSQVYGFAVQSGGRAWIETAPGGGVAVRLSLPVANEARPQRLEKAAPAIAPPPIAGPVLLVEDNPGVAELTRELLSGFGYEVVLASDAAAALDWVRGRGRPGLVITDIVMPGMNGVDLAQILRQRWPDLPVVLATGYAEVVPGPDWPLLRKPYGASELTQSLAAVLSP